ncbi:hypothetical protein DFH07DRAFT_759603 [Mycena maculata]|uniref:Uncharacterized protein n=1 Tax=Mycena maculata TaxID=230809 RepID=A0AAD7HLF4_9AGAR|nr:hypothetical protein DFH07DRAFT_759603 [Mycena maculata]
MKFISSVVLSCMAVGALSQGIRIGAPLNGTTVKPGSQIIVEVDKPDTLTGSTELALVIGFLNCFSDPCPSPMDRIGDILYNGSYRPQFHTNTGIWKLPYQNFTVTVPESASCGDAQLSVIHFSLVGAGPFPFLQSRNITLVVERKIEEYI